MFQEKLDEKFMEIRDEFLRRTRLHTELTLFLAGIKSDPKLSGEERKVMSDALILCLNDLELAMINADEAYPEFSEEAYRAAQQHVLT